MRFSLSAEVREEVVRYPFEDENEDEDEKKNDDEND
jgi:hypothetical protein